MLGKIFVWLLATVLLATVCSAQAQQPKKVSRIGYLSTQEPARESGRFEGIWLALRETGYIEGRNSRSSTDMPGEQSQNCKADWVKHSTDYLR